MEQKGLRLEAEFPLGSCCPFQVLNKGWKGMTWDRVTTMLCGDLTSFLSSVVLVSTSCIQYENFFPIQMLLRPSLWLIPSHLQQRVVLFVLLKLPKTSCHGSRAGGGLTGICLLSPTKRTLLNQISLEAHPICFTRCHLELPLDVSCNCCATKIMRMAVFHLEG